MGWDLTLWLLSFFAVAAALGILIYQGYQSWKEKENWADGAKDIVWDTMQRRKLMCLSDLEFDYINPFDSASSINKFVLPEFIIQGSLCAVFLLTGHWVMALINAPVVYYHVTLYMNRQHLVDVTEIFSLLGKEKKYRLIKLGFYVFLFFIVIYRLVMAAVLTVLETDSEVSHSPHFESF